MSESAIPKGSRHYSHSEQGERSLRARPESHLITEQLSLLTDAIRRSGKPVIVSLKSLKPCSGLLDPGLYPAMRRAPWTMGRYVVKLLYRGQSPRRH